MDESLYIEKDNTGKEGLDYSALRKKGVQYISELSGNVWTDYNEHDPGITILEQCCYALTSLSYLTETPLPDLLCDRQTGRIDTQRQALFIPKDIYPVNPWTADDYRKLLLDHIPAIGNLWITPIERIEGLYELILYLPEKAASQAICQEVKQVYAAHRDLCEDLDRITILGNKQLQLYADIAFTEPGVPEVLLAKIFFEVGQYLSPEIKRYSLEEMAGQGLTGAEIFEGPLLRNGFIRTGDLQAKQDTLFISRIEKLILAIPGIENIRNIYLQYQQVLFRQKIDVPTDIIYTLDTRPSAGGSFTVRFFRKGTPYTPDPTRVARELLKLYQVLRMRYRLDQQYERFFAVPTGNYKEVERYYSIQQQFPMVYGINRFGLLQSDPPERKAKARQLKGYLLVFEQLIADFQAQLAHVRDLFSVDQQVRQTYYCQGLEDSIPNIKPILEPGYKKGLEELVERMDPFSQRRNRFLDLLLALYAESIPKYAVCPYDNGCHDLPPEESLIHAKLLFLQHLVTSTHDRGRAFDYLNAHPGPVGMEWKIRILLGMSLHPFLPLTEEFSACGYNMVKTGDEKLDRLAPMTRTADEAIDNQYETVGTPAASQPANTPQPTGGLVDEEWITAGPGGGYHKVGLDRTTNSWEWIGRQQPASSWRTLGRFETREKAMDAAAGFSSSMKKLCCHFNRIHIIEHTLLRYALRQDDGALSPPGEGYDAGDTLAAFPFGFHLSVIISGRPGLIGDAGYRTFAEHTVAANTPAHLMAGYYWLSPWQMWLFELLYWAWRKELAAPESNPRLLARLSRDIILFLHECNGTRQKNQR